MEYRYINEPPKGFCVPHTWGMGGELNAKIIQALIEELSLWEKLGYSFKFGIEQEYQNKPIHVMQAGVNGALSQGSVIAHDVVEQKRQLLLVGVENESTRNLILQFKPEELARFELERRCLGATNTVFGRYYDERYPDSVMEIPFTAASPLLAINNFHMVLSTMSNVNSSMGIQPPNMYKTDISFSVWQHGNNNISDIQNRDPRALAIMDGLLRYVYDAAPIFMRKYRVDKYLSYQNVDTGPIRAASVRQADGRFEIRLDNNPTAGEHIASTILAVMRSVRFGFMLHGIESEAIGSIPQGHPSLDPNSPYFTTKSRFGVKKMFEPIDKDNDSSFYTLEILNGSKMGAEGVLTPNPKHLYIYAINRLHIIRELETRDGVNITNWFSKIKVDGNTIIWPPLEEITDNPVSVKAKLDNISFGREITVIKSDGYQVNPGYDRFDHRMMEAHTTFMRESPNLAVTYDPVMIAQLADGLLNQGKSRVLKN